MARWTGVLAWRVAAVDAFLDAVERTTRAAPISTVSTWWLDEHTTWLGRHEQLFPGPDDWRDALVVAPAEPRHDHNEPPQLGWDVSYAREGERDVRVVTGPFATGVHRVARPVDECHPLRGDLPIDRVTITALPKAPSHKWQPDVVVASLDGVTAEVAGGADVERIARLLVAARRRS